MFLAGFKFRIGSPVVLKTVPWKAAGMKPLLQLSAPE